MTPPRDEVPTGSTPGPFTLSASGRYAAPEEPEHGDDTGGPVWNAATVHTLMRAVADRLEGSAYADPHHLRALATEEVAAWVHRRAHRGLPLPTPREEDELVNAVVAAISGLGPLQPLLDRQDVENIHIHGHDQVWLELADGRLEHWPHPIAADDHALARMLAGMFARLGQTSREFSSGQPIGNVRLPGGGPLGARLAAVMEVTDRPRVAIRRHRHPHIRLADLTTNGTIDSNLAGFLRAAVRAGLNLLVTGGPAAGKTTLLRALAREIPTTEHVITVEEEYELGLHLDPDRPLVTPLEARTANAEGVGDITLDDLLKQALRHSPHRVILGEVRGGEVTSLLRALGNGASGGMGTLHANSAGDVADRIANLGQLAHPPLPIKAAYRWTASALDLVVHLQRRDDEHRSRYVAEVAEIGPIGDADRPDLTSIFAPTTAWPGSPARPVCPPSTDLLHRLEAAGLDRDLFGGSGRWRLSTLDRGGA